MARAWRSAETPLWCGGAASGESRNTQQAHPYRDLETSVTVHNAGSISTDDVSAWADLPVAAYQYSGEHVADNNVRASFAARTAIGLDFEKVLDGSEVYYSAEIYGES